MSAMPTEAQVTPECNDSLTPAVNNDGAAKESSAEETTSIINNNTITPTPPSDMDSPSDSSERSSEPQSSPEEKARAKQVTEDDDDITPLANKEIVMAPKMQNPIVPFVPHSKWVKALPKPTEQKSLRSYKTLRLSRWQYGLKHPGFCTFAGIDKDDMTSAVVPGVDWLVNNELCTVITPFLKAGSPHMVAFVKSQVMRRILDDQGNDLHTLHPDDLYPDDLFALELTDVFDNCVPAPLVEVAVYEKAVGVVKAYMGNLGAKTKSWIDMKVMRTFKRQLQEQKEMQVKTVSPAVTPSASSKKKKKTGGKSAPRTRIMSERVKQQLFAKRSEAAKRSAATRKHKRQEQQALKRKKAKQEEAAKRRKEAEMEAAERQKATELEEAARKRQDEQVMNMVSSVKTQVRDVVTRVRDAVSKELALCKTSVEDVGRAVEDVAAKTSANAKCIQGCVEGLKTLKKFVEEATKAMSIAGHSTTPLTMTGPSPAPSTGGNVGLPGVFPSPFHRPHFPPNMFYRWGPY